MELKKGLRAEVRRFKIFCVLMIFFCYANTLLQSHFYSKVHEIGKDMHYFRLENEKLHKLFNKANQKLTKKVQNIVEEEILLLEYLMVLHRHKGMYGEANFNLDFLK